MSAPPNHKSLAGFAGRIRAHIECARSEIRGKNLPDAIECCEIASASLKRLEGFLSTSQELELLREIHAAWALANHVPSDAPGSWESQMMRKIECVLGMAQEVQA